MRVEGNNTLSTTVLAGEEFNDLEVFSNSCRTAYNMSDDENHLFVAVAWMTRGDLHLLNAVSFCCES